MQGFNMGRYVPPEHEGVTSGNALHSKRPPGQKKRSSGGPSGATATTQTVRFEMPFAVWCTTCQPEAIIGQGVRFNAEKRRAGSYYTSPVFAFRMRHPPCGGVIEIRTDPASTSYLVTEGGRRRDTGESDGKDDSLVTTADLLQAQLRTPEEIQSARQSAFDRLERTIAHRERSAVARARLDELGAASAASWADPYARNRALRATFRAGRHARERDAAADEGLRARLGGLSDGLALLPASAEDAARAALVDFGSGGGGGGGEKEALGKPLFPATATGAAATTPSPLPGKEKKEEKTAKGGAKPQGRDRDQAKKLKRTTTSTSAAAAAAARARETLASEVMGNTRMAQDPFLLSSRQQHQHQTSSLLPGLKRKRGADPPPALPPSAGGEQEQGQTPKQEGAKPPDKREKEPSVVPAPAPAPALVSYDSDSD